MKKLGITIATAVLGGGLLLGCGEESTSVVDVANAQELTEEMSKSMPTPTDLQERLGLSEEQAKMLGDAMDEFNSVATARGTQRPGAGGPPTDGIFPMFDMLEKVSSILNTEQFAGFTAEMAAWHDEVRAERREGREEFGRGPRGEGRGQGRHAGMGQGKGQGQGRGQGHGGGHGQGQHAEKRQARLQERFDRMELFLGNVLSLTDTQKAEVSEILTAARADRPARGSGPDREGMKKRHEEIGALIQAKLTDEQSERFEALKSVLTPRGPRRG